jgi:hypothetical protein
MPNNIVEFAKSNPHAEEHFRNTFTSDKMFFHTILGNSPRRSRIRKNLAYANWYTSSGRLQVVLNDEHVKLFEAQEKIWVEGEWGPGELLFERKCSDDSLDLLAQIGGTIRRKEKCGARSLPMANA